MYIKVTSCLIINFLSIMNDIKSKILPIEEYALKCKNEEMILSLLMSSKVNVIGAEYMPSETFLNQSFELGLEKICDFFYEKRLINETQVQNLIKKKKVEALAKYFGTRPPVLVDKTLIMLLRLENQKLIDTYFAYWANYVLNFASYPKLCKYLVKNGLYYEYCRKYLG